MKTYTYKDEMIYMIFSKIGLDIRNIQFTRDLKRITVIIVTLLLMILYYLSEDIQFILNVMSEFYKYKA